MGGEKLLSEHTYLLREPFKIFLVVVLQTNTQLELTRHAHPLGPFDICVGYGGDTLRVNAFPCHTAGRDPELWNNFFHQKRLHFWVFLFQKVGKAFRTSEFW